MEKLSKRYNIAPTQPVPVLRRHPEEARRVLSLMRWGLVPSWSKDMSGAAAMINARSETAANEPAFRDPLRMRRCLIPADGFYEWKANGSSKQPYCFEVKDGELLAFAGLWDGWKNAEGQWVRTCTILTTMSNALTATVHDRIPVLLDREAMTYGSTPQCRTSRQYQNCCDPMMLDECAARYSDSAGIDGAQNHSGHVALCSFCPCVSAGGRTAAVQYWGDSEGLN